MIYPGSFHRVILRRKVERYVVWNNIFFISFFSVSFTGVFSSLPPACRSSELDHCFSDAYNKAGITQEIPSTLNSFFVNDWGILQLSTVVGYEYEDFCRWVARLLEGKQMCFSTFRQLNMFGSDIWVEYLENMSSILMGVHAMHTTMHIVLRIF